MKTIIIILLLIFPCLVMAQTYQKIDANTATVVPASSGLSIKDLQAQLTYLQNQVNRCSAQYQSQIASLQAQIDGMALAGVDNAVPLASATVQAQIATATALAGSTLKTP